MTVEQASNFFVGSILTMMGFIVVFAGVIVINNLLSRYWKPVKLFTPDSWKAFNPPISHQEQSNENITEKSSRTEVHRTQ